MDKSMLQTFWVLAEGDVNVRHKSTVELLTFIKAKQGNSKKHCEELLYTLDRLIKGLASSRKVARLGFTAALTQVLRSFPVVRVSDVIDRVSNHLQVNKSDNKSDQNNAYIGCLMAYQALIQSGHILKAKQDDLEKITQAILHVWKRKIPLHQMCSQALVELISKIPSEEFTSHVWPLLEDKLKCGWERATPDTFWLLLASEQYHHEINQSFFSTHWKTKNVLNKKNNEALANIIVKSTEDHPMVHPVCMNLVHKTAKIKDRFESFWTDVIYEKVFLSGSNCKFLVFQLIPEALKLAKTPDQVYVIMSPRLIACLIKNLSSKQQVLHSAAKRLNCDLIKLFDDLDPPLQVAMVITLITPPGTVLFDNVVKTHSVQAMIPMLSVDAIKILSNVLKSNIQGEIMVRPNNTDEESKGRSPDLVTQQKWSTNILSNFINQTMLSADPMWCNSIAEFLFLMSFFEIEKSVNGHTKPKVPLEHAVTHTMSTAFFRSLDKMVKFLSKGVKGYQMYNDSLHRIVKHAQSLLDNEAIKLVKAFDSKVLESWKKMIVVTQKIKKKREKSSVGINDELAFELLFLHHGIQLFIDPKSSMEVLQELHTCYGKATEKKRRRSTIVKISEEPEWVDVIVDLLMSLISQQSHLVRTVVNTVCTMLCPHLTRESLQLILEPFAPTDEEDKNPLDFEESEGKDSNDEEAKEEEDSDLKEDEESSDSDSDSSSEEVEEENGVNESLISSVKSALGGAAVSSDDEESGEELDDEAMFRLDGALAAAFRGTAKAKKKLEQEKEIQLKHYKMRCLDILEVIVTQCKSVPLLLDLVVPLLAMMEAGVKEKSQQELGKRARRVFTQLLHVKKLQLNAGIGLDKSVFPEMVKGLLEYSTKVSGIPMIKETASACVFVIQLISSAEKHTGPSPVKTRAMAATKVDKKKQKQEQEIQVIDKVLYIVEEAFTNFCVKRDSRMSHYFFLTMLEKEPTLFWPLAGTIQELIVEPNVRIFCRTQASTMLTALINKSSIKHIDETTWLEFATRIIETISNLLEKCGKEMLKPRYLHEMLVLLHRVCTVLQADTRKTLVSEDLLSMVNQLKTSVGSDTRPIINKITGVCHYRVVQGGTGETKKKKKRKHKKSQSEEMLLTSPEKGTSAVGLESGTKEPKKDKKKRKHKDSQSDEMLISPKNGKASPDGPENSTEETKKKKKRKNRDSISDETLSTSPEKGMTSGDGSINSVGETDKKKRKHKDSTSEEKLSPSPEKSSTNGPQISKEETTPKKTKKRRDSLHQEKFSSSPKNEKHSTNGPVKGQDETTPKTHKKRRDSQNLEKFSPSPKKGKTFSHGL